MSRPRRISVTTVLLVLLVGAADLALVGAAAYQRWGPPPVPGPAAAASAFGSTQATESTPTDVVAGSVLLDLGPQGVLWRATRGDCAGEGSPTLTRWGAMGAGQDVAVEGITDIVAIDASAQRIVGLDDECRPVGLRMSSGRLVREQGAPPGVRLVGIPGTQAVAVGAGTVPVPDGCVPSSAQALAGGFLVTCGNGDVWTRFEGRWSRRDALPGLVQLAAAGARSYVALGISVDCSARLTRAESLGTSWTRVACLAEHGAGVAVAAQGEQVAVQVGSVVLRSTDAGRTFEEVAG